MTLYVGGIGINIYWWQLYVLQTQENDKKLSGRKDPDTAAPREVTLDNISWYNMYKLVT